MSDPQSHPPASDGESRVLEIEGTWEELTDEQLEEALTEICELAGSASVRYGYQRKAHALADFLDAQFDDVPETADAQY